MPPGEKRTFKRAYRPIPIELLSGSRVAAATIENISASGAFIDSGAPLASGALVHFRAPLPDAPQARPIEGNARVIWHAPHGAGVEFQDMSVEDRKRLKLFVDSHSVRPAKKRRGRPPAISDDEEE
jgi:hypothetical protein